MTILIDLIVRRRLFEEAQLKRVEELLRLTLPEWCRKLSVLRHEDDWPGHGAVAHGSLPRAIQARSREEYGIGNVILRGGDPGFVVYLQSSRALYPPTMNSLAIEWSCEQEESPGTAEWIRAFVKAASHLLAPCYGRACSADEFSAKNVIADADGEAVIGLDLAEHLPGLYWLNYFGPEYISLLGYSVLSSAPWWHGEAVSSGYLASLYANPSAWGGDKSREAEAAVLEHLGHEFFFCRADPDKPTTAPDFLSR